MTKESKRIILDKFIVWLSLSDEEKQAQGLSLTQKEFAIHHGIKDTQLSRWKAKIDHSVPDDQEWQQFMTHLTSDVLKTGAKTRDRELYARIQGKLIEKREDKVTLELTANDYNRIASETLERLREDYQQLGGSCPLCGKSQSFLDEVCVDNQPQHGQDSEVATVGVSS